MTRYLTQAALATLLMTGTALAQNSETMNTPAGAESTTEFRQDLNIQNQNTATPTPREDFVLSDDGTATGANQAPAGAESQTEFRQDLNIQDQNSATPTPREGVLIPGQDMAEDAGANQAPAGAESQTEFRQDLNIQDQNSSSPVPREGAANIQGETETSTQ